MHIETAFRSLCDGFTSFIFLFSSSSFSSQVGNFPFLYIQYAPSCSLFPAILLLLPTNHLTLT